MHFQDNFARSLFGISADSVRRPINDLEPENQPGPRKILTRSGSGFRTLESKEDA